MPYFRFRTSVITCCLSLSDLLTILISSCIHVAVNDIISSFFMAELAYVKCPACRKHPTETDYYQCGVDISVIAPFLWIFKNCGKIHVTKMYSFSVYNSVELSIFIMFVTITMIWSLNFFITTKGNVPPCTH